jgi:hypothetical protein
MGGRLVNEITRRSSNKPIRYAVDVANVLQIRPETVSRWNQGKAFPQPDVERTLLDLEYVVEQLADLYEPDEARLWIFSRQKLLGGNIPTELIQQHRTDEVAFTRLWPDYWTEDERGEFVAWLALHPEVGDVIKSSVVVERFAGRVPAPESGAAYE